MELCFPLLSKPSPPPFILRHTLFLLPALIAASVVILLLTFIVPRLYSFVSRLFAKPEYQPILLDDDEIEEPPPPASSVMPSGGLVLDFRAHLRSLQEYGSILFALEVVRTLCLCALLGLSIDAAVNAESPISAMNAGDVKITKQKHWKHKGKKHKGHHDKSTLDDYSSLELGEFGVCAFYVRSFQTPHLSVLMPCRPTPSSSPSSCSTFAQLPLFAESSSPMSTFSYSLPSASTPTETSGPSSRSTSLLPT